MNIYVAAGVTSNLFASLISLKAVPEGVCVYATARATSDPAHVSALRNFGVQFVDNVEQVPDVKRILWLSTHDDVEVMTKLATIAPTLAISSGAIMDFLRGKQTEESLNGYQKSKLAVMRISGVTKFVPGFYLEDMPLPRWASKGLHGDTHQKLFGAQLPSDLDWSKCYSVTPKSYICAAIQRWIMSDAQPGTFIVSSDREYRRWELRALSDSFVPQNVIDASPAKLEPVYKDFEHILRPLTDFAIEMACKRACSMFGVNLKK